MCYDGKMKKIKVLADHKQQQIDRFELKIKRRTQQRQRKSKPTMRVDGKSVFQLQALMKKRAK